MFNNLILFYSKQYNIRVNILKGNPIFNCTMVCTVLLYTKFFWFYYQNIVQFSTMDFRIRTSYEIQPGRLYLLSLSCAKYSTTVTTVDYSIVQYLGQSFCTSTCTVCSDSEVFNLSGTVLVGSTIKRSQITPYAPYPTVRTRSVVVDYCSLATMNRSKAKQHKKKQILYLS